MSDVVVIGAGLGGLCAALDLASAGRSVTVLEALPTPGGKANVVVVDGVEVDTGPSVLTLPDAFDAVLRRAGTSLAAEVTLTLPEPASRYVFPDGAVVDVFSDRARTREAVTRALGATAAAELDAFLDYSRRIWEAAAPHFVMGDAPGVLGVLALGPAVLARDLPRIDPLTTMRRGVARYVRDERVRWILERFATYNGSDPARAPATLNCIAHVELGLGVHGVEGGIHALVRALVRVATARGVVVRTGTPVSRIELARGRAVAVHTHDGERLPCRAVVANADVAHLVADLLPPGTLRLPRQTPSMSGWVGVLKARRRDRAGHTVLFPSRYDEEFRDVFDRHRPPVEPTVYLCAQERCHRRVGWPEHEPIFAMANAPPEPLDGASPAAQWTTLRQVVLDRLRTHGLIDPDDEVVWERSPTGLATTFPRTRGSLYGAASNDPFAAFRRPPNRLRQVPGLYLASGSAHPGGGMPLCALSGQAAARAILEDLG